MLNGDTWGDIAQHAVDLREWGAACELDRAQIRTFVEQSQEGPRE